MNNSNDSDNNSDMDTGELLNSPIETSATWSEWTAQDVKEIAKLQKYHIDMISFITKCRESGPSRDPPPTKIRSEVQKKLYMEDAKARKQGTIIIVSEMTGEQFHCYLLDLLGNSSDGETLKEQMPENLSELSGYLDKLYSDLKHTENSTLKAHFQWGKYLNMAKDKFDCEKRKKRLRETWRMWIETNTQIKEASARRHRETASLVTKYPKLENLQVPYADFLKIKNKIKEVFSENIEIGEKWI
jgi:hypothetical protein